MNPALITWMHEQHLKDKEELYDLIRKAMLFLASFINPEAVKKLESSVRFESSPEDFDKSLEIVEQHNKPLTPAQKRIRKRKFKLSSQPTQ